MITFFHHSERCGRRVLAALLMGPRSFRKTMRVDYVRVYQRNRLVAFRWRSPTGWRYRSLRHISGFGSRDPRWGCGIRPQVLKAGMVR